MSRNFPIVKFLIILDGIALVSLLLTAGYKITLMFNYPSFVLLFIVPIVIVALVLFEWGFSILWNWVRNENVKLENSFLEFIGVLILQAAYCFGLIAAWYNFFLITYPILAAYILVVIITSLVFLIYIYIWVKNYLKYSKERSGDIVRTSPLISSKKNSKDLPDFDFILKTLGFMREDISSEYKQSIIFNVPETNKYYEVISQLKIDYIDYLKALQLTMKLQSDSLLSLVIRRRDSAFGHLKDELIIPRLANVYVLSSPTPEVWVNLFNDTLFKENLLLLRPYLEQFSLKGQYVEVIIYSEKAIAKVLDWVFDLNPSMERLSGTIKVSQAEAMLCYNCQDPFDPLEDVCTKCGSPRPRCIVCFQDLKPEIDTDVVILPCCKIYAHKEHMIVWLRKKPSCPNCHADLSRWINKIGI